MKKIFMAMMLICSVNAFSQADDPADGDGTVPVDGGLVMLIAAGTAYGGGMVRKTIKNRQCTDQ
jgi:hypothetical protein